MLQKVNVTEKLSLFNEHWNPKIVGHINNFAVKVVKLLGEFEWHHHDHEDEMFYVVKGKLIMQLRDGDVEINEGEFIVVPHEVEHRPVAPHECHIMLIEPAATVNTGNVISERTVQHLEEL